MATCDVTPTDPVLETVTSVLDCPICLERFRDPRVLSCGHSFCLGCLEPMVKNSGLSCPTCRRDTPVPGAVRDLPRPYVLLGVLQALEGVGLGEEGPHPPAPLDPSAPAPEEVATGQEPQPTVLDPPPPIAPVPLPYADPHPEPSAPPVELGAEGATADTHSDLKKTSLLADLPPLKLDWNLIAAQICNFCSLDRSNGVLWHNCDRNRVGSFVGSNKIIEYTTLSIEVLGLVGDITLGLCHDDFPHNTPLGVSYKSVGYNLRDGQLYHAGACLDRLGPVPDPQSWCDNGDKIRMTVLSKDGHLSVQFNRNGKKIYLQELGPVDAHHPWYPAICLTHAGDMIRFRDTDVWAKRVFKGSRFAVIDSSSPHGSIQSNVAPPIGQADVDDIAIRKQRNKRLAEILQNLRPIRHLDWSLINSAKSSFCHLDSSCGILQYCDDRERIGLFIGSNRVVDDTEFTIEIASLSGRITVGLTTGMPQNSTPGIAEGSIAFQAHDGQLYVNTGSPTILPASQSTPSWCDNGDRIKCVIAKPEKELIVTFFKNGNRVFVRSLGEKESQVMWFPVISLHKHGDVIRFLDTDVWMRRNFKGQTPKPLAEAAKQTPNLTAKMETRSSHCEINLKTKAILFTGHRITQFISSTPMEAGQTFNIEVLTACSKGSISLGMVHGGYPEFCKPGWYEESVSFHLDDGGLYYNCERAEKSSESLICKTGDRVQCLYTTIGQKGQVTFFRNGVDAYHRTLGATKSGVHWYPCISLSHKSDSVRILEPYALWSWITDPPQTKVVFVKKKKNTYY